VLDMPHSFAFGLHRQQQTACGKTDISWLKPATRRAQPGASAKSAERPYGDVSASRRFGRARSVWCRSFRRVRDPASNCDCGVFFAGAAPEARPRVIASHRRQESRSRTVWITFHQRGTTSSVSVTSSPSFDSFVEPQQGQLSGAAITTRSRGRCPGKGFRAGRLRSKEWTTVEGAARSA
jgi:hypothetical protein